VVVPGSDDETGERRGRRARRGRAWLLGIAVGIHLTPALAQDGAAPPPGPAAPPPPPAAAPAQELIQIRYDADATCPSYEAFIENVHRYTSRWGEGEGGRRFLLKLEPRDGRVLGTLEIVQPRASRPDAPYESASREIAGPDCETVARGMAIAVAVAIDPQALLSGSSAQAAEPAPPPPPPRAPLPEAAPPARERALPASSRPVESSPPPRLAVDARLELTSAVVVGLLPVFSAAFEVDPFARSAAGPPPRLPRWLRPSLAVGLRQSSTKEVIRSSVVSDFLWTAAVVRLCPVRFSSFGDSLEVTPCIEGDLGVLQANARGSSDARRTANRWFDVGASARASWKLAGPWFVGGAVSVVMPVTRNRFELATKELISQAPRIGVTVGLSAGLRF
jgi:hypothetical protein